MRMKFIEEQAHLVYLVDQRQTQEKVDFKIQFYKNEHLKTAMRSLPSTKGEKAV